MHRGQILIEWRFEGERRNARNGTSPRRSPSFVMGLVDIRRIQPFTRPAVHPSISISPYLMIRH